VAPPPLGLRRSSGDCAARSSTERGVMPSDFVLKKKKKKKKKKLLNFRTTSPALAILAITPTVSFLKTSARVTKTVPTQPAPMKAHQYSTSPFFVYPTFIFFR
jgi:hypothetical protein